MVRPCKCRCVAGQAPVSAFKPAGVPGRALEAVALGLDELEALRLADLEGLYQDAAAQRMGISRPTFGRLLECARHKVACALFCGKMLVFKGGPIVMWNVRTFECADCGKRFEAPYGGGRPGECPHCHGRVSIALHNTRAGAGRWRRALRQGGAAAGASRAERPAVVAAGADAPGGRESCGRRTRRACGAFLR